MRINSKIGWHVVRVLLTAGLVMFCMGAWPGYLFHTYQTVELYTADVVLTPWLSSGDMVQQHFSPTGNMLSKVRVAVSFDVGAVTEEYLVFTLWNESGKSLCERKIYFNQIESDNYFDVFLDTRVKSQEEYVWSLMLTEPTDLQYAVLCTDDVNGNAQENHSLLVNSEDTQYNAVNQYEYYAHYDKAVIVGGFWAGAFLVWLLLSELLDRAQHFFERKGKDGKDGHSKKV